MKELDMIATEETRSMPEESIEAVEMPQIDEEIKEPVEEPQSFQEKLIEDVQEISQQMGELAELFRQRIQYTDFEEHSRANMHKELQEYREGMYAKLVKPILMDIIEVREDILKTADSYGKKQEGEQAVPLSVFLEYAYTDLEALLEKYDVEAWQCTPGDSFQPERQKIRKRISTDQKDKNGRIAESLSRGYSYQGKVIRSERVNVYVYEESVEKPEEGNVSEEEQHG